MVETIAATSLSKHLPACVISFKNVSNKTKPVGLCCLSSKKFMGREVHLSMCLRKWVMPGCKAQAMELTRDTHSFLERERMSSGFSYGIGTGLDTRPVLWPPENKADNPVLCNPLLRQERMGCGWIGAIFEWEGVLIEDNPDLEKQAWLVLSQEEGKPPLPAFLLRRIQGMKNEQAISEVLCWSRDPVQVKRMAFRKEEIHQSFQGGIYRFRPGSQELVNVLTHYKVPMALVSTRPRKYIQTAIRSIGVEGVFTAIVVAEDVYRGKPDPEMFIHAAQLLQFIPERCIVFGNSNQTIEAASYEAAHDARMKCVAVASKHPVYELGAADLVVTCLNELSFVDLKKIVAVESDEFGSSESEAVMEVEEESDHAGHSSVGVDDAFW